MPRGGRRSGRPGKAYANRTDLNGPLPVQAASGQPYGARIAQERAQQAVPLAAPPRPAPPPVTGPALAAPAPGGLGDFLRPTERPNEPLTSGIDSGPGPGSEALRLAGMADTAADELRAIYLRYPTEALRELLEDLDSEL